MSVTCLQTSLIRIPHHSHWSLQSTTDVDQWSAVVYTVADDMYDTHCLARWCGCCHLSHLQTARPRAVTLVDVFTSNNSCSSNNIIGGRWAVHYVQIYMYEVTNTACLSDDLNDVCSFADIASIWYRMHKCQNGEERILSVCEDKYCSVGVDGCCDWLLLWSTLSLDAVHSWMAQLRSVDCIMQVCGR